MSDDYFTIFSQESLPFPLELAPPSGSHENSEVVQLAAKHQVPLRSQEVKVQPH